MRGWRDCSGFWINRGCGVWIGGGSESYAGHGFHDGDSRDLVGDDSVRSGGAGARFCVEHGVGTGRAPVRRVALIWYRPIYAQSPSIKSTVRWSVLAIGCYGGSHVSWIIPTQEKCAWQGRKRRAPASERSGNPQCRPYSSELYALHADYITKDENNPLVANWREIWLSRAHSMLIQANEKLALLEQYIDSDFKLRVARLFADLSTFMWAQEYLQEIACSR